jgi:hypothetical protein
VPRRLDLTAHAESPVEALEAQLQADIRFGENIGLGRPARRKLVRLIERGFEGDLGARGHVAQQLGDRDEVRRGHDD